MDLFLKVTLGLLIGLPFGYALQRGRFCLNSAFRDVILAKDFTLLRAWLLALLVQMIGVHLMAGLGWIGLVRSPFWWQAAFVGGFVFGWGMALSGG